MTGTTANGHRGVELATPVGPFLLWRPRLGTLRAAWKMLDPVRPALAPDVGDDEDLNQTAGALRRYFAGEPVLFPPIDSGAGTPFQRACSSACRAIPPGQTRSYGQLAAHCGRSPGAARAVGQAMRVNPLPVLVPCHRVVAAAGGGGYAGHGAAESPGLRIKQWLLKHEQAMAGTPPQR